MSRFFIQLFAAVLTNANFKGFFTGLIFKGPTKYACVPTLNCYSCPGALFSCPIGAAQVILSSRSRLPFFVIGFLSLCGAVAGRASCGWICPFGWFQEILHKIPSPKFNSPKILRFLKYFFLAGFVILLPAFWLDSFGMGAPYFCEFICPAGTLEGGIILPILNSDLQKNLGKLFLWKMSLLIFFLGTMIFFRRPFCSWVCPLGAFLAPFNRFSLARIEFWKEGCVHCGLCDKVCPVNLKVELEIDGVDCIRCLDCGKVCPKKLFKLKLIDRTIWEPSKENSRLIEPERT